MYEEEEEELFTLSVTDWSDFMCKFKIDSKWLGTFLAVELKLKDLSFFLPIPKNVIDNSVLYEIIYKFDIKIIHTISR